MWHVQISIAPLLPSTALSLSLLLLLRLRIVKEKLQKFPNLSKNRNFIFIQKNIFCSIERVCSCDRWRTRWLPMKLRLRLLVRFLSSPLVLATPSLYSVRLLLLFAYFSISDPRSCEIDGVWRLCSSRFLLIWTFLASFFLLLLMA